VPKEQVQQELKGTLKAGDTLKRSVLSGVMSSIQNKELSKRTQLSKTIAGIDELTKQSRLTDDEIQEVLASEAKKRKESIEQFKNGGRDDLVDKEQSELDILSGYLPEQLDDETVASTVKEVIVSTGAQSTQDMGRVMGEVMKKLKGKADGNTVNRIVKEELGK